MIGFWEDHGSGSDLSAEDKISSRSELRDDDGSRVEDESVEDEINIESRNSEVFKERRI